MFSNNRRLAVWLQSLIMPSHWKLATGKVRLDFGGGLEGSVTSFSSDKSWAGDSRSTPDD